jgi:hypothetical protein
MHGSSALITASRAAADGPVALTCGGIPNGVRTSSMNCCLLPYSFEAAECPSMRQIMPEEPAEVAAYYAVSEALANAAKHAHTPRQATSNSTPGRERVQLAIRDDGIGGGRPSTTQVPKQNGGSRVADDGRGQRTVRHAGYRAAPAMNAATMHVR